MTLQIDDSKTIRDLQERFSLSFPGFRIELCNKPHHWEELCEEGHFLSSMRSLGSVRKNHHPGVLEIRSSQKIGEIEERFRNLFGLNVQIFFKSNGKWIQTVISDNLTIADVKKQTAAMPTLML